MNKKDMETIKTEIKAAIEEVGHRLIWEGSRRVKDLAKLTKKRLYAYPQLKKNIERYKLDIADIQRETFGKSKSIVIFQRNSGDNAEQLTIEEQRAAKIRLIEQKIERDEAEIKDMDAALSQIKNDSYYRLIEMRFFQKMNRDEIAEKFPCDSRTVSRQLGRLLDTVNISLYGADALS